MQRILIIGVSSLVGTHLALRLRARHHVIGTYDKHRPPIDGVPFIRLSLRQDVPWPELFRLLRPDVVYYCAAERDEKACQNHPLQALAINAEIPVVLARALEHTATKLVYYSTSKVFSGDKGDYTEEDEADGTGHYGKSKHRAEELLAEFERVYILRLGTLWGLGPVPSRSLLNRFLLDLWAEQVTPLIDDEFRSFQSAEWVAEASERLLTAEDDQAGLYHLPSPGRATHYGFAVALGRALGLPHSHFTAVTGKEFSKRHAGGALRGTDTTLNGSLFESTFGITSPSGAKHLEALAKALNLGTF